MSGFASYDKNEDVPERPRLKPEDSTGLMCENCFEEVSHEALKADICSLCKKPLKGNTRKWE
jgi:hypothetical protein